MILYFTGNGNSRWVAERLAESTGDRAVDISDFLKKRLDASRLVFGDSIGLVFPVHSWYAPRPVVRFAESLRIPSGTYRYAVCTCGDNAGMCMERLEKHFPLDAAWSVIMPNTYIPMFDLDSDELAREKVAAAAMRVREIAAEVLARRSVRDILRGDKPRFKTYAVNPLFTHLLVGSRKFTVSGECVSCGKCEESCPVGNISMIGGRPAWGRECIHCMACIHGCPQHATNYGEATVSRGRYDLRSILGKNSQSGPDDSHAR